MNNNIPLWVCIVKSEQISPNGHHAYRIIQAIATTYREYPKVWEDVSAMVFQTPGYQTMLFLREPEKTPIKDAHMKEVYEAY